MGRLPRQPLARHLLLAVLGAVVLYFITSALSPYNNVLVGEIALYLIALAGLSLLTGTSGQISLGQGAFMAVGAYTVALLMTHTQMNFFLELLASIGAAATLGLIIGISATRLKGPYLAGVTLLLALALPPIADKWSATFGGDQGLDDHGPDRAREHQPRTVVGLDRARWCVDNPGSIGQLPDQPVRALVPCGP